MLKYGLLDDLSRPDMAEHKFDRTRNKTLAVGKWKKSGGLASQKVAKTGNIEKKVQWQAVSIM